MNNLQYWDDQAREMLVGKKITKASYAEDHEWGYALEIHLDDGNSFVVQGDDEGNQPGALYFNDGRMLPQMH